MVFQWSKDWRILNTWFCPCLRWSNKRSRLIRSCDSSSWICNRVIIVSAYNELSLTVCLLGSVTSWQEVSPTLHFFIPGEEPYKTFNVTISYNNSIFSLKTRSHFCSARWDASFWCTFNQTVRPLFLYSYVQLLQLFLRKTIILFIL